MSESKIQLYDAIKEMRRLTALQRPFSFIHATYEKPERKSHGFRIVRHALLRPSAKEDSVQYADEKLFYTDLDINEPRNCWQVLITYFNDKRIYI